MVTDYDCWHTDHDAVSVDMVIANLQANATATGRSSRGDGSVHQKRPPSALLTPLPMR